jgi:hypothetical protein
MSVDLSKLIFSTPDTWKEVETNNYPLFIPQFAQGEDGANYMRGKGKTAVYKVDAERGCTCLTCGSEIISETVTHPIWDGPFLASGSGRCQNEEVPYCPKCELKPNYHGQPIAIPSSC